jgi:hypothetical protein
VRNHLGFLKISSLVVKTAAWIFLLLGLLTSISVLFGALPAGAPRWVALVVLAFYAFIFFILYFIAKTADLLVKVAAEIKKES